MPFTNPFDRAIEDLIRTKSAMERLETEIPYMSLCKSARWNVQRVCVEIYNLSLDLIEDLTDYESSPKIYLTGSGDKMMASTLIADRFSNRAFSAINNLCSCLETNTEKLPVQKDQLEILKNKASRALELLESVDSEIHNLLEKDWEDD